MNPFKRVFKIKTKRMIKENQSKYKKGRIRFRMLESFYQNWGTENLDIRNALKRGILDFILFIGKTYWHHINCSVFLK